MYIWRGKNRRDKRNLLLLGETFWGAQKGAKDYHDEDRILRCEGEQAHIMYYTEKIRLLMKQYLATANGKEEIVVLVREREMKSNETDVSEKISEEFKENVLDIFQSFCQPNSMYIDTEGVKSTLANLQFNMNKLQLDTFLKKLNLIDNADCVEFEGFFKVLNDELSLHAKSNGHKTNLPIGMQQRLMENSSKMILIDEAVYKATMWARSEYRKAHPSELTCEKCDASFSDKKQFQMHMKDNEFHAEFMRKRSIDQERFHCVECISIGNQGRKLNANRLIFSKELASMQDRVDNTIEDPYRPAISDTGGLRYSQQLQGALVQGNDAKAGIRTIQRRTGLIRQYLAPARRNQQNNNITSAAITHPRLQDVLNHLHRCSDNFIDTVSTYDNPANRALPAAEVEASLSMAAMLGHSYDVANTAAAQEIACSTGSISGNNVVSQHGKNAKAIHVMYAIVRFRWNYYAKSGVFIIGEFTGWQPEEMTCSSHTGKFSIVKKLSPGRYRYRFIVDGTDRIDVVASQVRDVSAPGGISNELLVTNTPLFHIDKDSSEAKNYKPNRSSSSYARASIGAGAAVDGERSSSIKNLVGWSIEIPVTNNTENNKNSNAILDNSYVSSSSSKGNVGFGNNNGNTSSKSSPKRAYFLQDCSQVFDNSIATTSGELLCNEQQQQQQHQLPSVGDSSPSKTLYSKDNEDFDLDIIEADSLVSPTSRASANTAASLASREAAAAGEIVRINKVDRAALMHRLQIIDLRNLALYDDGAWVLSAAVHRNSFIQSIDLSFNYISDEGIQAFSRCLPLLQALHTLKLNGNGFGYDGCRYLTSNLAIYSMALHTLELSANRIGDDGFEVLCKYMTSNAHVTSLHVDSCYIGDIGMEFLHNTLLHNRSLHRLSLISNRISSTGIMHLREALSYNASLLHLNLSSNPLGPDAAQTLGDLIALNDSLLTLEIADIDLLGKYKANVLGLHAICFGIKANKNLTSLNLRNNYISDLLGVDIAHALMINLSITELDISGNKLEKKWFDEGRLITTHILPDMPSIATSLKRNRDHAAHMAGEGAGSYDVSKKQRIIDDVWEGKWSHRRQWKKELQGEEHRKAIQDKLTLEQRRIDEETNYINKQLEEYMKYMGLYLDQIPCKLYIKILCKFIAQYFYDLPRFDPHRYPSTRSKYSDIAAAAAAGKRSALSSSSSATGWRSAGGGSRSGGSRSGMRSASAIRRIHSSSSTRLSPMKTSRSNNNSSRGSRNSNSSSRNNSGSSKSVGGFVNAMLSLAATAATISTAAAVAPTSEVLPSSSSSSSLYNKGQDEQDANNGFHLESFLNTHLSVIGAIFTQLHQNSSASNSESSRSTADKFVSATASSSISMMISPLRLQHAFHLLSLPLPATEVQPAVDATLVTSHMKIGLHKFSQYVLRNALRLSKKNTLQRIRILADLMFNPPLQEARTIILSNLQYSALHEFRTQYRAIAGNEPLYVCPVCHKRFVKETHMFKHCARGGASKEHRRHQVKQVIYRAQSTLLQEVKWAMTGIFFPSYFELIPSNMLPKDYFPQVFDKIGAEGRPFGVVEANRTVRALDVFGEYLYVSLYGQQGWLRYRNGKHDYLQPACFGMEGFNWDKIHLQEDSTYYRVNDMLSSEVELKVRYQPRAEGEVLGYLRRDQVVECMAVIGDWLQVRYEKEDCAWVRWRSAEAAALAAATTTTTTAAAAVMTVDTGRNIGTAASTNAGGSRLTTANSSKSTKNVSFAEQSDHLPSSTDKEGKAIEPLPHTGRFITSPSNVSNSTNKRGTTPGTTNHSISPAVLRRKIAAPLHPEKTSLIEVSYVSAPFSSSNSNSAKNSSNHSRGNTGNSNMSGGSSKVDRNIWTPGEHHEDSDGWFNDGIITYEINGKAIRVNLNKQRQFSRDKITHFNLIRFGSSEDGTSAANLLMLPRHVLPLLMDTSARLPGKPLIKPQSPITLTQRQLLDHIIAMSNEEVRRCSDPNYITLAEQEQLRKQKQAYSADGNDFSSLVCEDGSHTGSSYNNNNNVNRNNGLGVQFDVVVINNNNNTKEEDDDDDLYVDYFGLPEDSDDDDDYANEKKQKDYDRGIIRTIQTKATSTPTTTVVLPTIEGNNSNLKSSLSSKTSAKKKMSFKMQIQDISDADTDIDTKLNLTLDKYEFPSTKTKK